mgnify:CR=1 FL=1
MIGTLISCIIGMLFGNLCEKSGQYQYTHFAYFTIDDAGTNVFFLYRRIKDDISIHFHRSNYGYGHAYGRASITCVKYWRYPCDDHRGGSFHSHLFVLIYKRNGYEKE